MFTLANTSAFVEKKIDTEAPLSITHVFQGFTLD